MTAGRMFRYAVVLILALVLIILHTLSTASFRFKIADYYRCRNQYAKAIGVYSKILRKDLVKPELSKQKTAQANFGLGYLAAKLDFRNVAIEAYTRGYSKLSEKDLGEYYFRESLDCDKLAAIGLLEAGKFEAAVKEFRELAEIYPDFHDAARYIDTASDLRGRNITPGAENFYFDLGDGYIKNRLFKEARGFFTKRILDYAVSPLDTLRYLDKKYSRDAGTVSRVWGDNIYVILDDFENINTRLKRYLSNSAAKVNRHYIMKGAGARGGRSEFLDITYSKKGYDYWSEDVSIPLSAPDLNLGIRLFIKSDNSSRQVPLFWISYGKETGSTGVCNPSYTRSDLGNGWEEWRVNDLSESARNLGLKHKRDVNSMTLEKVIVDIQGASGEFYLDEIELFLAPITAVQSVKKEEE